MNRDLEHLLSRAYDGALAPIHREDLERSGLTAETIRAAYIRSVPPGMISRLLSFPAADVQSAYVLPFRAPAGGFMNHVRLKIFPALTDANGHAVKYLGPSGAGPRLYFAPMTMAAVLEGEAPVWCVEGEKKSLAVAQLGLPAVGFCGIEVWHVRGSRELLPDFDAIRLAGRTVELAPDGDWQTNPNVERGVTRLADALRRRGARPRLVVFPRSLEGLSR
jgi:hypothetical protein